METTKQPTLLVDRDAHKVGSVSVSVHELDPDLIAFVGRHPQMDRLLRSVLRVGVVEAEADHPPDVFGRYQLVRDGVRFIPHFPFESGVSYRATFDPRPLGHPALSEVLTVVFRLPSGTSAAPTQVTDVFPTSDLLPENILRFYVRFSNSMQRGRADQQIRLLDADGRPAPDVLYRPPVELWDRSMRHLTILLDPGRLKRWVGPNRELGPPLKAGREYTLVIGSGMVDLCGRRLRDGFHKPFRVTDAVRKSIGVGRWRLLPPTTNSHQPLALVFPEPLDWALLWHAITIATEAGESIDGRIAIDQNETRWRFTPTSPWAAGAYQVRVASSLEDVCGNGLRGAFDRPLRSGSDMAIETANRSIPFQLPHR